MLTFYPEFEASAVDVLEFIFILDLSNSMRGDALRDGQKALLLSLRHLPPNAAFNVMVFGSGISSNFLLLLKFTFFSPRVR